MIIKNDWKQWKTSMTFWPNKMYHTKICTDGFQKFRTIICITTNDH